MPFREWYDVALMNASTIGHIGIVACSAEGAALCYRTICAEGAQVLGPHAHPEVSMHTPPFADYVHCLDRGDWDAERRGFEQNPAEWFGPS